MMHQELAEQLAEEMVDGMDMDTLVMYAVDHLRSYYEMLSPEELRKEVEDFYPHLLETIEDDA